VVELVKANDRFEYQPGRDARPRHEVDWFGDRGRLRGVYSYAVMNDGATSKVVVLSEADVHAARDSSASWKSERSRSSSPWTTHTEAMWLKTAAHRLRKWVPTSAEYRREIARASAEAHRVAEDRELPDVPPDTVLDGEVVDEPAAEDWPATTEPGGTDG
jgi:recombination protein RecT